MTEQEGFLAAIEASPDDSHLRHVYADWLLEHDQPEEAERQRQFIPAMAWMREFAGQHHNDYREDPTITAEELIQAGTDFVVNDEYYVQQGSESLRDDISREDRERYWRNWEIITGLKRKPADGKFDHSPFCCTC